MPCLNNRRETENTYKIIEISPNTDFLEIGCISIWFRID